jgi:pimeloyl-ACP methyl ester carboxylesterase
MWFVMGQLQSSADIDVTTFDYIAGDRMQGVIFIPQNSDLAAFRPSVALVGPGLPAAPDLPFEIPNDMGAIVSHSDAGSDYFDIFTQINFYKRAHVEAIAPVSGRYYMVVFGKPVGSARYALDIGIEETYAPAVLARYPINWWEVHDAMGWSRWPAILYTALFATAGIFALRRRTSPLIRGVTIIISLFVIAIIALVVIASEARFWQFEPSAAAIMVTGAGLLSAATLVLPGLLLPLREHLTPQDLAGGRYVDIDGHHLHVVERGPHDGTPVVLLHGFASSTFTWRALAGALATTGHRVIAIDQLGNGASSRPTDAGYTTQDQARLMAAVVQRLGVARAHWVGHSFGGRLAMQIALQQPERVASLVLIAPEAFATRRPAIANIVSIPLIGRALCFFSTSPALVKIGLRLVSAHARWLTKEVVAGYAQPLHVRGTLDVQLAMSAAPKDGPDRAVPANLRNIEAQTLIVWGARDPVFPAADGARLVDAMPNARIQLIPGAGHIAHEESPDLVNDAILAHLQTASSDETYTSHP